MKSVVVADAGPLIGLARAGALVLLRSLYGTVFIPTQVAHELRIEDARPGSRALKEAMDESWLVVNQVPSSNSLKFLSQVLDSGEAAAIILAGERKARFLLIDERRGRRLARERGLQVVGTAGLLLAAKKRGYIEKVEPVLELLSVNQYWMADGLRERVLALAGER